MQMGMRAGGVWVGVVGVETDPSLGLGGGVVGVTLVTRTRVTTLAAHGGAEMAATAATPGGGGGSGGAVQ